MPAPVVFGLDTFGDATVDAKGNPVSHAQTIRDLVEQVRLADQLGLYGFGIGEHHREDFAVSAPDTVLAGMATVTENIRLGTAVTILSTDDPVRVYERFATLQALSNGRAEISVGRGSYLEGFQLFGYRVEDSFDLFDERLDLLARLLIQRPVSWQGKTRSALNGQQVWPKLESALPLRVAVGGSPESAERAARMGLPLALSVISGDPARFADYISTYRASLSQHGWAQRQVSVHGPGYIAATDGQAIDEYWPHYDASYGRISRERGQTHIDYDYFVREVEEGALYVGSADTVARKIARTVDALGVDRFDFKYNAGPMTHAASMRNIEIYAGEVEQAVSGLLGSGKLVSAAV